METVLKAVFVALWAVAAAYVNHQRRIEGRERIRRLEAGEVCIRCDRTNVYRDRDFVVCDACGFRASMSRLLAVPVSDHDIDGVNRSMGPTDTEGDMVPENWTYYSDPNDPRNPRRPSGPAPR